MISCLVQSTTCTVNTDDLHTVTLTMKAVAGNRQLDRDVYRRKLPFHLYLSTGTWAGQPHFWGREGKDFGGGAKNELKGNYVHFHFHFRTGQSQSRPVDLGHNVDPSAIP